MLKKPFAVKITCNFNNISKMESKSFINCLLGMTGKTWQHGRITVWSLYLLLALPCIAHAEVSDKEPSLVYIWMIGLGAALFCMLAGRVRRWLVPVAAAFPALWFLSLFLEIHSADVGPALYAEQGGMYYLHACLALAATALGAAWGWRRGRR